MSILTSTFGVEIECYLPEGATQQQAAAAVSQRLGSPCYVEGYNHQTRNHWKVVTDGSLSDVARGVEFVSPILKGVEGFDQIEKVCKALVDFGCTVSKKCGLHVHVGVGYSPEVSLFRNIVKLYSRFETVLDSIMPASRRASTCTYARTMTTVSLHALERAATISQVMAAAGDRHHKLNLGAYSRHRTIEFRHHSGTLDGLKARMWTILCLRMIEAAKGPLPGLGSAPPLNQARPGSKAHQIGMMLLRPEGVTGQEICTAMGWPSVSIPAQAKAAGLQFITQRTGRQVRYFAVNTAQTATVPNTLEGFAQMIGASDEERAYMAQRATDLGGSVQWAA